MARSLIMVLVVLFGGASLWPAGAEEVLLSAQGGVSNLQDHLTFYREREERLTDVLRQYREGRFSAELADTILETNYAPEAWAGVNITNDTLDDGRPADRFVITLDLPLVSAVDIYLIRANDFTEALLNYSAFEPFLPEDHSVTRLKTPVFEISAQETVTLLVNFKFGPFQSFHMALETPRELEETAFRSGVGQTAFYVFGFACLVFFVGFHLSMANWMGVYYALMFAVGLSLIGYIDGFWFRFFYPEHPEWQSVVGFFHLFALSGVGFVAAGRTLTSNGEKTGLSSVFTALALLSLAGFAASLISPGTYVATFGYGLLGLMFISSFVAGRQWRQASGYIHRSSLVISAAVTLTTVLVLFSMVSGSAGNALPAPIMIKGIFMTLLIGTMTGLTAHIINLRRDHAKAEQQRMLALEQEAKTSQELLVAERNYTRARELAHLRQRQLATASHDLKQPIASLRMTFDSLAEASDPKVRTRLREAFDYMEALSNDYLRDTAPDAPDEDGHSVTENEPEERESYQLSLIIDTIQQMFQEEAISKGLQLRCVASSLEVIVPALALMRIVSNLVSNAVKYTEQGRVLVGVRRRRGFADLHVIDTGPGMTMDEQIRFREAYSKGGRSEGHGLGLAVCFELAEKHALELTLLSRVQKGSTFILSIPLENRD